MAARRPFLSGALVVLATFCAATSATAGTASVVVRPDSATLLYRAAPGERNHLSVSLAAPGTYELNDRAGVVAGPECRSDDVSNPQRVLCTLPQELPSRAMIQTGDRNDSIAFGTDSVLAAKVMGGPGSDSISGPGTTSEPGVFRLWEVYALGRAEPRLVPSRFEPGAQPGVEIHGGPGLDEIYGGAGDDCIYPGSDHDLVRPSGGDDAVFARDGSFDTIECDSGRDRLVVDRLDFAWSRCGRIRRRGPALPIPLAAWSDYDGGYIVELTVGCPADVPAACNGSLILSVHNGPSLVRRRYRAPRGDVFGISPFVSDRDGEDLQSRGAVVRISSANTAGRTRWIARRFRIADPGGSE